MNRVPYMKAWCASVLFWFVLNNTRVVAGTNAPFTPPPVPPVPTMKSPVDSFRTLLVMPAADRQEHLATRPADVQKKLVDKIREYQALTPDERELRLKATELRWYLKPLMSAPATNRAAQVKLIPENLREMVAARIEQWDKLPAAIQQIILTNQHAATYITLGPPRPPGIPSPAGKIRTSLQQRFNQLFELTPSEKEKVLATLSDAERRQMEKTLESFGKLNPIQRRQCVTSFTKFAAMSPAERQEFLKNAQRWSEMSPAERQSWRELVNAAPKMPPLPQITIRRPPPLPVNPHKSPAAVTTNGG
jgi:hypothetical protein